MTYGNTCATLNRGPGGVSPIKIRIPDAADGKNVWSLIRESKSVDDNSLYCNLLQTTHFASTCAIAERGGDVVGWLSGYLIPHSHDTLFVWQVCVGTAWRGNGLGRRLIADVLARPANAHVTNLQCTITEMNGPSWALFNSIARRLNVQLSRIEHFTRDLHFGGRHESEYAVSVGPFDSSRSVELISE